MLRRSLLLRSLIAVLTTLPVAAESVKPESVGLSEERLHRIHDAIQHHIQARNISGAVTLVARRGRIVHVDSHGLMDLESGRKMATDSIFRIYSMTKPVAGVAIMMLMEEGKVRLNDPVSRFIPEFKEMKVSVAQEQSTPAALTQAQAPKSYTIPAAREITIQDLLTHVSGLGSVRLTDADMQKIARTTLAEQVPQFAASSLAFQPGSRWTYSPLAAFDTLGRVVEVVSGQTFEQFLRHRLFEPLGMKETFFHTSAEQWPRVVTAYTRSDGALKKTESPNRLVSMTYSSGAGGLMSTARDYAQFALMLSGGGQLNGRRILSPKTVELMSSVFVPGTTPGLRPGRSFGLSVQVVNDPIAAGQRVSPGSYGWDGAYGTHFWVDPKEKIVGILMVQTSNPDRQVDRDFESAVMQAVIE